MRGVIKAATMLALGLSMVGCQKQNSGTVRSVPLLQRLPDDQIWVFQSQTELDQRLAAKVDTAFAACAILDQDRHWHAVTMLIKDPTLARLYWMAHPDAKIWPAYTATKRSLTCRDAMQMGRDLKVIDKGLQKAANEMTTDQRSLYRLLPYTERALPAARQKPQV